VIVLRNAIADPGIVSYIGEHSLKAVVDRKDARVHCPSEETIFVLLSLTRNRKMTLASSPKSDIPEAPRVMNPDATLPETSRAP
jgi:hypothetical protein